MPDSIEKDIGQLQAKVQYLEQKINQIESIVSINSTKLLTSSIEWNQTRQWLDRLAKLIGYAIMIGALFAAGKVTGLAELVLKVFKL